MTNPETAVQAIKQIAAKREHITVAIDGRCGSGKTTFANAVAALLPCEVLHMDDFFLRPEQRTPQRAAEAGGNVDYERFLKEVLEPLSRGERFLYRPFDCHSMSLTEGGMRAVQPITLVEGTYSCHPTLWDRYDLHIFLSVSPQTQEQRLLARGGQQGLATFRARWIPPEEAYFAAFDIGGRCELVLQND